MKNFIFKRKEEIKIHGKHKAVEGYNDLKTLDPSLASEFDDEKNYPLRPAMFTGCENDKVWWKCKLGHSWATTVKHRFIRRQKCPYCTNRRVLQGFNDLATTHPHIAVEWDNEKNGVLRPEQFTAGSDVKVWWKCKKCGHSWLTHIYTRKKHGCPCCARNILVTGINDLQTLNPTVANQWDKIKNGLLTPKHVAANDNSKAWWLCGKGHSWQAVISSRHRGRKCPYCTSRFLLEGFNDLATLRPDIAAQMDCSRNHGLGPHQVAVYSSRRLWWSCQHGHHWKTSVSNRSLGTNCPVCENTIAVAGVNDLKTLHPDVAKQWHKTKNGSLTSEQVTPGSSRKTWWTCERGHSFEATVVARVHGSQCPYCIGKRPIVGETDFASVHPELLDEWDKERNHKLKPQDITASSHKKPWWKCSLGHRWKTAAYNRHVGHNCPVCEKLKDKHIVIAGVNDFATLYPAVAKEWDDTQNEGLTAHQVLPGSNKKVGWKCKKCGHRWVASVLSRKMGTKCPRCYGKIHTRTKFIS